MSIKIQKQSWDGQDAELTCTRASLNSGKVFATGWSDKKVRIYALGNSTPVLTLEGMSSIPTGLSFNRKGEVLAAGGEDGSVTFFALQAGKIARQLEGGSKPVTTVAFHPSGSFAVSAGKDLTTRVWDLRSSKCVQTYSAFETTTVVEFSPEGNWIVSGGSNGMIKVWDVRQGKVIATLKKHSGPVTTIQFHPSQLIMSSGGEDGQVQFWDMKDFSLIAASGAFKEPVRSLSFSSDGKTLISASDSTVRTMAWEPNFTLWDSVAVTWGKVSHSFVKSKNDSDKLIAATIDVSGKIPSAWVVDLAVAIKPFAAEENAENIVPEAQQVIEKKANQPPSDSDADALETAIEESKPVLAEKKVNVTPEQEQPAMPVVEPVAERAAERATEAAEEPAPEPVKTEPVKEKKVEEKKQKKRGSRLQQTSENQKKGSRTQRSGSRTSKSSKSSSSSSSATRPAASDVGSIPSDRSTVIGLRPEEFRMKSRKIRKDEDAIALVMEDHYNMCASLVQRHTNVKAIRGLWVKESVDKAVTQLASCGDLSVVYDILGNLKSSQFQLMSLQSLRALLPEVFSLIQSEFEDYVILGCTTLRRVVKSFGSVIKSTRDKQDQISRDPIGAERVQDCNALFDILCHTGQQLRENMKAGGRIGPASREVLALFRRIGVSSSC